MDGIACDRCEGQAMRRSSNPIERALVLAAMWRSALCLGALACFLAPWMQRDPFRYTWAGVWGTVPYERHTGVDLLFHKGHHAEKYSCIAVLGGVVVVLGWQDYLLRRVKRGGVPSTRAEIAALLDSSTIVEGLGLLLWQGGLTALFYWERTEAPAGPVASTAVWLLVLLHTVVGLPSRLTRAYKREPRPPVSSTDPVRSALDWLARWFVLLAIVGIATPALAWRRGLFVNYWVPRLSEWHGLPWWTSRLQWQWLLAAFLPSSRLWIIYSGIVLILWWNAWTLQRSRFKGAAHLSHMGACLAWGSTFVIALVGLAAWSQVKRYTWDADIDLVAPWTCAACFLLCATLTLVFSPAMMWRAFRLRARNELSEYLQETR